MRKKSGSVNQGDLFGTNKIKELKERVKELDDLISQAVKKNQYQDAKSFTEEQKKIIQELVMLGEK